MVTGCNLLRQKFNATNILIPDPSHTSLPKHRGNKNTTSGLIPDPSHTSLPKHRGNENTTSGLIPDPSHTINRIGLWVEIVVP